MNSWPGTGNMLKHVQHTSACFACPAMNRESDLRRRLTTATRYGNGGNRRRERRRFTEDIGWRANVYHGIAGLQRKLAHLQAGRNENLDVRAVRAANNCFPFLIGG